LIAGSQKRSRLESKPRAKVAPPALFRAPSYKPARGGAEGSSKFPGAPPGTKVSQEQSSLVAVARNMAGEEKLAVSISSDGSTREEKNEKESKKKPSSPTFPVAAPPSWSLPAVRRPAGSWGRVPGGRALTSVSGRGAARSTSSELRAAVPGPGSRCAGCIANAAASGQPPGVLHAWGRLGTECGSPQSSHGSGARAWTAPPAAGRSIRLARLASVPQSLCERCRPTPSPAAVI
jgi:hypothetical protein